MAKKKLTHQNQSSDHSQNPQDLNLQVPSNRSSNGMGDSTEKLVSLKSLNAILLKETVEKRQEVQALVEKKKSLESELTRSESQVQALMAELNLIKDRDLGIELEKGVVSAFMVSQVGDLGKIRGEIDELRRENECLKSEKKEVQIEKDELECAKFKWDRDITSMKQLVNELNVEVKMRKDLLNQTVYERDLFEDNLNFQIVETNNLKEKLKMVEERERDSSEEVRKLKVKCEELVKDIEERESLIQSFRSEMGSMRKSSARLIEELKGEKELICRKNVELEKEKTKLNASILSLKEKEEKWRSKFSVMEKVNAELKAKSEDLEADFSVIMMGKEETERESESLMERLGAMVKELENLGEEREGIRRGKTEIEQAKMRLEDEIVALQMEVSELRRNLLDLQLTYKDQIEKNDKLVAEIALYKDELDRVRVQRDDARLKLNVEKMDVMKLKEEVSEMTKKIEEMGGELEEMRVANERILHEKKEVEIQYNKLVEQKDLAEKKVPETQKKIADLQAILQSKSETLEHALSVLKNTAAELSSADAKKVESEEEESLPNHSYVGGEIEQYLVELRTIQAAFRMSNSKVKEMEKEVELMRVAVAEATKKKSMWAMVSSGATIFAAVASLAYAARVR